MPVVTAPLPAALERQPLSEQVATRLIALIQEGPLEPGHFLPSQHELCRQYGVSRPILREALRTLVAAGFIDVQNGKGAMVVSPAPDPLANVFRDAVRHGRDAVVELMELRRGIESDAAALAAARRTATQAKRLRLLFVKMQPKLHDFDAYNELDLEMQLEVESGRADVRIPVT